MSTLLPAGAGLSHSGAGPLQTIRFPVDGMTCGACVVHVTKALRALPGVDHVKVDLRHEVVTVRRDPTLAPDVALAAAIAAAGYALDTAAGEVPAPSMDSGLLWRWRRR